MKEYFVTFRWGVSRGRDTAGFTTCACRVDGKRMGFTSGGNYDLKGSAFAEAVTKVMAADLLKIADKSHTIYPHEGSGEIERALPGAGLYGMVAQKDADGKIVKFWLDGACGFECMWNIVLAAGWKIRRVDRDAYILTGKK